MIALFQWYSCTLFCMPQENALTKDMLTLFTKQMLIIVHCHYATILLLKIFYLFIFKWKAFFVYGTFPWNLLWIVDLPDFGHMTGYGRLMGNRNYWG